MSNLSNPDISRIIFGEISLYHNSKFIPNCIPNCIQTIMKVFASLLAIAIVSAAPVNGANNCGITKIDFEKSTLVQNKLHLKKNNKKKDDGTLRYQGK